MKSNWKKRLLAGTVSLVMTASMVPALGAGSMALADSVVQSSVPTAGTWDVDSLTLQPGETTASINLNWYAPEGTTSALVWFGGQTVEANVRSLTTPTQLNESKYTDTGKLVCEATVSGLAPATEYTYLISVDGGATWRPSDQRGPLHQFRRLEPGRRHQPDRLGYHDGDHCRGRGHFGGVRRGSGGGPVLG